MCDFHHKNLRAQKLDLKCNNSNSIQHWYIVTKTIHFSKHYQFGQILGMYILQLNYERNTCYTQFYFHAYLIKRFRHM